MKEQIQKLRAQGKSYSEIVEALGCSKSQVAYHSNPTYKKAHNERTSLRRKRIKEEAVAYKGGKCHICSYDRCLDALEFHHVDPTAKDESLDGYAFARGHTSLEKIKPELDKCVLLCVRCHREVHAGLITI